MSFMIFFGVVFFAFALGYELGMTHGREASAEDKKLATPDKEG